MHFLIVLIALAASIPTPGAAQARSDRLPRAAAREVIRLYEEPNAIRASERTEIPAGRVVQGHVAVIDGPIVIGGHVQGRVLAINSDVILQPGARIDGDLLVVGGEVEGQRDARIDGEIRVYRQRLRFTRDGERLVLDPDTRDHEEDSWWRRWERRRSGTSFSELAIASAGAYNRVEGLPVHVGPMLQVRGPNGSLRAEAFAILRTGSSFRSENNDVGHRLRLEARSGRRSGFLAGGEAFNAVAPVENWQLNSLEYGLMAFLFRRDYLDLYGRHGGRGYAGAYREGLGEVTASFSHERWAPRMESNIFSLFRDDAAWRENPLLDAGRLHILSGALKLDTRNDDDRPWSGWYVNADLERGTGEITAFGPAPVDARPGMPTPGPIAYTRGFVDARRYNRVGPMSQLNLRVVAGGWLGGDPLPLQRRLSVSGPGALPGFDFRSPIGTGFDVATCNEGPVLPGRPALCDRIALLQVEYRGDLHFDPFGGFDWETDEWHFDNDPVWVLFADAGRGWRVDADGRNRDGSGLLPPLSSFRTDLGLGLDFGEFGIFIAKSVSDGDEPLNFLIRLRHRF